MTDSIETSGSAVPTVILMIPYSVSIVRIGNTFRKERHDSSFEYRKIRESFNLQYRSNASISVSFQVVIIGALDLEGHCCSGGNVSGGIFWREQGRDYTRVCNLRLQSL